MSRPVHVLCSPDRPHRIAFIFFVILCCFGAAMRRHVIYSFLFFASQPVSPTLFPHFFVSVCLFDCFHSSRPSSRVSLTSLVSFVCSIASMSSLVTLVLGMPLDHVYLLALPPPPFPPPPPPHRPPSHPESRHWYRPSSPSVVSPLTLTLTLPLPNPRPRRRRIYLR